MAVLVWCAYAVIAVFARSAARVAGVSQPGTIAVGTLGLIIAGSSLIGRVTSDLLQATLLTGLAALAGLLALHYGGVEAAPTAGRRDSRGPTPWVLRVPIAVTAVGVFWATLSSYFWDEYSCHYMTASVMARGVLPPELPVFPGEPFRYHYAYDVIAAHVQALTGWPIDVALDVATLISFAVLLAAARQMGRRLGGRWGGGLAMLLIPLGGGALAFLLFGDMGTLELHWSALPRAWMQSTPPPVISNFFQHPQGLGMSFALIVVDVFGQPFDTPAALRRRQLLVGIAVLGCLGLAHIVFFAVLGLALGVGALARAAVRRRALTLVEELAALIVGLGFAYILGGFLAPGPDVGQVFLWGQSFFKGSVPSIVAQYLVLFGLPLILLPWAIYEAVRRPTAVRVIMVAAALIGFAIPNFVIYARSWDIVKFLGIGMFFANVLAADRIARWRGRTGAVAATIAVLLCTNTAWIWLARVSVFDGRFGVPKMHFPPSNRPAHEVAQRLAGVIPPRDRVFTSDVELARAGGLLAPGFDWRRYGQTFMLDRPRADAWRDAKRRALRSLDPEVMKMLDVRWAVLSPHDFSRLDAWGRRRIRDPALYEPVDIPPADIGGRKVYRLLPPAYGEGEGRRR